MPDPISTDVALPSITIADVKEAIANIEPYAHFTPVVTCETLNRIAGHSLFFKCENFQKTGAFKFRGAINAISHLTPAERSRGVVTHSSGNHAQALSRSAQIFGIPAHIVMPTNSPAVKKAGVVGYGGRITECEPTLKSRQETAALIAEETGATMIPSFNHRHVIAGQGTCAAEFLKQVPELERIVAPIGGGGLISGTCIAANAISKRVGVIGAEPAMADDAFQSRQKGELIPQLDPQTIADGLRTSLGRLTWPFVRNSVQQIICVSEDDIRNTMKLFLERTKILIEPSSAVAVAVALRNMGRSDRPMNVGVIISGGNVDLDQIPWL